MTSLGRALLGAACGSLLTLLFNPVSRSFFVSPLLHPPGAEIQEFTSIAGGRIPLPENRVSAALWLLLAAEKSEHGIRLSTDERRTLIGLATKAEQIDPENAFWPQMKAVLLAKNGDQERAKQAWRRASTCRAWDDMQTERLLQLRFRLSKLLNCDQAWMYGFAFFQRSDAAARQVQQFAKSLISHPSGSSDRDLADRYATIQNGSLLRDGSRSLRVGGHGAQIVELATYPSYLSELKNPKRIWIAETSLTSRLRESGRLQEADRAQEDFKINDAWRALTERENPEDNVRNLCLATVGISSLPGAIGCTLLICGSALLVGTAAQARLSRMRVFPPYGVAAGAAILGGVTYLASASWPAALSVALCAAFLATGPFNPRTRKTDDLGPLFSFVVWSVWAAFLASFVAWVISIGVASRSLLPWLGPAGDYVAGSSMFAAVGLVVSSLLCLVSPAWAVVNRYGTPDVAGLTMRRFGAIGLFGGLLLCVCSGPISVYADTKCSAELVKIVGNEPGYYLTR